MRAVRRVSLAVALLLGVPFGTGCSDDCSDSNCTCEDDEDCDLSCPQGVCAQTCSGDSQCTASCEGGGCYQSCRGSATCTFSCAGGDCTQICTGTMGVCTATCTGEGCVPG